MLFTAIAATVVILPWAAGPATGHREQPARPGDTQLAQQPLVGLGGGVTVREISQATTFSMVALTGGDLTGTSARIRARHADGSWGPWYETETLAHPGRPRLNTGPARHRSRVRRQDHDRSDRGPPPARRAADLPAEDDARPPTWATSRPPRNNRWRRTSRLSSSPRRRHRPTPSGHRPPPSSRRVSHPTSSLARNGAPTKRCTAETGRSTSPSAPRSCITPPRATTTSRRTRRRSSSRSTPITPRYWAGATSPTTQLVDKYGQVFEGRAGALTGPVQGDHTGGFNRDSWGVAMIGNFDDVAPTPIQLRTLGRLLGWRLGLDHVDPRGTVALTSAGGSNTNYPVDADRDAADHLQPPRRRRHRLPGQRRLRAPGRNSRYRRPFQRPTQTRRPGYGVAGRCHL